MKMRYEIEPEKLPRLFPLLQQGVTVRIALGDSLSALLRDQWGFSPELEARISTIFLDGKPVDQPEQTIMRENATLALSSAMPGLVGAVMRRGGVLASFRSGITHREASASAAVEQKQGDIEVKLFNAMLREAGPLLLRQGFYAAAQDLRELIPEFKPEGEDPSALVLVCQQPASADSADV